MIYWILALAAVMRLIHLANGHHFIVSPDSYYFHDLAKEIAAGGHVDGHGSGLAYLLALGDAVWWNSVFWPVFFGVLSTALLYLVVKDMWNKRTAIASAFCFAIAFPGIFQQAAGAVDRDCLHLLLIGVCTFALYYVYRKPVMLLLVGCLGLMWYEWGHITIAVLCIAGVGIPFWIGDMWYTRPRWKPLIPLAVTVLAVAGVFLWASQVGRLGELGRNISELAPMDGREVLAYLALIPAMLIGVFCLAKRRHFTRADWFVVCWLAGTFAMGLLSRRLWVFSVPAYSVLAGIGIAWVWKKRLVPKWALAAVCLIMVGFSGYYAYNIQMGDPRTSATPEMQEACKWLRFNTPEDSRIVVWWDWGYMVENLSERECVMDNGSHAQRRMELTWEALQGNSVDVRKALRAMDADYFLIYRHYPPPADEYVFCERVFSCPECALGSRLTLVYESENIRVINLR